MPRVSSRRSDIFVTSRRPFHDLAKLAVSFLIWTAVHLPLGASAANTPSPLERGTLVSNRGGYSIDYAAEPSPIPLNEMFGLHVTVRERYKRTPSTRVSLEVDAGMLAHNHGMNVLPKVERLPDGTFRVHGMLFHMSGEWNLVFMVKHGLMRDKAETDLVLR